MKDYILSVIAVSAVGCVVNSLCPSGEGKALKKTVGLIMSLLLILSVASPLISFMNSGKEVDAAALFGEVSANYGGDYENVWNERLEKITSEGVRAHLTDFISEKFSLDTDEFSVECNISSSDEKIVMTDVTVRLFGGGMLINPRKVESAVNESYGCECTVIEEWR